MDQKRGFTITARDRNETPLFTILHTQRREKKKKANRIKNGCIDPK